jgi:MFS transporter, PAT family, beta-lactamase induction signal transducer AmpG
MYKTKKFFVISTQAIFALCILLSAMAMSLPNYLTVLLMLFWLMSVMGAMQDISTDGVYITALDRNTQLRFNGLQGLSWNVAPVFVSGGLVYLSGVLHTKVFHHDPSVYGSDWIDAWRAVLFLVAAVAIVLPIWHWRHMPDGARASNPGTINDAFHVLRDTFTSLFQKPHIWLMISIIFVSRIGTGLIEKIGPFFMVDPVAHGGLGVTNQALGVMYGTYGMVALLAGAYLGGMYAARVGVRRGLLLFYCTSLFPTMSFLVLAFLQPTSSFAITCGVIVERFFSGFGGMGIGIYIMQQFAPGKYSTTHYSFGTAIKGASIMLTGIVSGHLQQQMGYQHYFMFALLATIPSFILYRYTPFHHEGGGVSRTLN